MDHTFKSVSCNSHAYSRLSNYINVFYYKLCLTINPSKETSLTVRSCLSRLSISSKFLLRGLWEVPVGSGRGLALAAAVSLSPSCGINDDDDDNN